MCRSKFVQIKIMNLDYLGFTNEARKLVGFDRCLHYFEINKPVYWELTLEMLMLSDTTTLEEFDFKSMVNISLSVSPLLPLSWVCMIRI